MVEAALLALPAVGEEPWPGEREAVRVDTERSDQVDVLLPAAVVIGGVADEVAALPCEVVPDRCPAAVGVRRALDLESGCRHAPSKAFRKRPHSPSSSAASQP